MGVLGELLSPDWSAFASLDMWVRLLIQLALLCGSAFFSGSETALFSLSRVDLQEIRRSGASSSGIIHTLLDQPRQLIISILCGNELVNVAASTNMTAIVARLYGYESAALVTTFIMVPLILLLGEVTPKTIAVSNPIRVSTRIVAPTLARWVGIVAPLAAAVRMVADRVTTWIVGPEKTEQNILRVDEFRTLVDTGVMEGELSDVERALIYNLLDAGKTEVIHIMTPCTAAALIDSEQAVQALVEAFLASRKKRAPLYRGDRDHIIGELRIEDVIARSLEGTLDDATLEELVRPVVSVVETVTVDATLDALQAADVESAVVVGEFGETLGVVTMTDIEGFLWGHVYAGDQPVWTGVGSHTVDGAMKLEELNRLTQLGLRDPRMTTVAGYVMRRLGKVPEPGDELIVEGFRMRVDDVHDRQVRRLTLTPLQGRAGHEGEEP
ncbi:MAG: hemolysin family protein [Myxococcales bacterium]